MMPNLNNNLLTFLEESGGNLGEQQMKDQMWYHWNTFFKIMAQLMFPFFFNSKNII